MALPVSKRSLVILLLAGAGVILALLVVAPPTRTYALPAYAAATGQTCATCHVNPAGGGPRNAFGQKFEAIPTHSTDPAGAFAQASGAAPAPAPAPPAGTALTVSMAGAANDGTVTYFVTVSNESDKEVSNIYVAGSIPAGAKFDSVVSTPDRGRKSAGSPTDVTAGFLGVNGNAAAWVLDKVPAGYSVGPFVYKVNKGSASDLSANAFAHWTVPSDAQSASAEIMPLTNNERVNVDSEIKSELDNLDRTTSLWDIQFGLGSVMLEYGARMNNLWFAAHAGNWDMVRYEIDEALEIQEVGETTRPNNAAALKNFEQNYLSPLDETAKAKDLSAFEAAYDKALTGCNSCHAGTGHKYIKVQRPTQPTISLIDFAGQQ